MKNYMKLGVLGALLTQLPATFAQDWHANAPSGNPINAAEWLGCDATSTQPLRIKTVPDYAIDLYTSDTRRLTLLPDATTYTIGSFAGQVKDGCLLRSPDVDQFYTNGGPGPFSIDHVAAADDNAEQQYYRPWMDVGTTYTGNNDQGYVGQKAGEEVGQTDVVLHWGGDFEDAQKDHLRALFTTEYTSATTGAGSMEGLEFLRLWPAVDNDPHIGFGDFYAANINSGGLITEPTERVDVVNGRVRFRDLPENGGEAEGAYKVMVVDDTPTPSDERGVVKWVDPAVFLGTDCDWTVENDGTSGAGVEHDVYTAVGNSNVCPDATDAVGIGMSQPLAKLDVLREPQSGDETGLRVVTRSDGNYSGANAIAYGIYAQSTNASGQSPTPNHTAYMGSASNGSKANFGMYGTAFSSSTYPASSGNFGGRGEASGPDLCHGLYGYASSSGQYITSYGVYGIGSGSGANATNYGVFGKTGNSGTNTVNHGVHGEAISGTGTKIGVYGYAPTVTGVNYAGFFQGDLWCSGTPFSTAGGLWTASDENLKTNPQAIGNASERLTQLQPKTFDFLVDENSHLNLPEGTQAGFYAQELGEVFPELMKVATVPADRDSSGNELAPAMTIHTINQTGLIPYLVAAFQEQNARIASLEQQLASCCSSGGDGRALPAGQGVTSTSTTLETDLRIIPNPVADRTELRYTVGTEGRVRLTITAPDGRTIRTQDEGLRAVGSYSYGWDTTALAPGTYHCTLFVNDELVVRKAVKVAGR